ncbi:MAG: hypothetical protein IJD30_03400 [Clostridia bacterium]|nr:hypothetical protein [Clostridia bacterium]
MMRTVFSPLPDSVFASGSEYKINTDFRVWIQISEIIANESLSEYDRLLSVLILAFKSKIPDNPIDAIKALMIFFSKGGEKGTSRPVIDFRVDEGLIYAAFMQQYGIDLYKADLHWWKFRELLNALGEDCMLTRIIGYRSARPSEIPDKKHRAFVQKMKNRYSLKHQLSSAEIAAAFE